MLKMLLYGSSRPLESETSQTKGKKKKVEKKRSPVSNTKPQKTGILFFFFLFGAELQLFHHTFGLKHTKEKT